MAHNFSNALSQYDNQSVSFAPIHISAEVADVIIKGKLIDPGDETSDFNFRIDKTSEGWKIYDIKLGGVDLIKTYKSDFNSTLQNGGVPKLISVLRKKNQDVKAARME